MLPKAHRADAWADLARVGEAPFVPSGSAEHARLGKEGEVQQAFLEALDASGIGVPLEYRGVSRIPCGLNDRVLAVAQHYGLPTRLLDWSRQPHVAAYFASLRTHNSSPANLAVWALNAKFVGREPTERAVCLVVETTRADNPNLHAQDGLFTFAGPARGSDLSDPAMPTIDEIVSNVASGDFPLRSGAPPVPDPIMRKFILPRDCAETLMRRLHQRRITAGRLFPGLGGVAMAVRERLQFGVNDLAF